MTPNYTVVYTKIRKNISQDTNRSSYSGHLWIVEIWLLCSKSPFLTFCFCSGAAEYSKTSLFWLLQIHFSFWKTMKNIHTPSQKRFILPPSISGKDLTLHQLWTSNSSNCCLRAKENLDQSNTPQSWSIILGTYLVIQ